MSLFAACRYWLSSHAARKRAITYLVAALLVVMTAAVPAGTLTAHAAGPSHSALSAQSGLTLTPDQGPPATKIHVSGAGFAPSGQVALYFNNKFVEYATPSSGGDISASMKVPTDPEAAYTVLASQASSNVQEQDSFSITPGFEKLQPKKGSDVAPIDPLCAQLESTPTSLSLKAWGLYSSAPYKVQWLSKKNNNNLIDVATGNTTASGTLSTSFQIPAAPGGFYYLIVLTDGVPSLHTTYYSDTYSCFTISEPGNGILYWNWDGVGWDANSTVDLNFNGSLLWQAVANSQGSIGASFMQNCPAPGTYPGTITGTTDGGQPVSIPFNPPVTVDSNC